MWGGGARRGGGGGKEGQGGEGEEGRKGKEREGEGKNIFTLPQQYSAVCACDVWLQFNVLLTGDG